MVIQTGMEKGAAISYDRLEEVAKELDRRDSPQVGPSPDGLPTVARCAGLTFDPPARAVQVRRSTLRLPPLPGFEACLIAVMGSTRAARRAGA